MEDVKAAVDDISDTLKSGLKDFETRFHSEENAAVMAWLSPLNFWMKQSDVYSKVQAGTGTWIFEHPTFKSWLEGDSKTLWCPGIPGAGKTVQSSILVEYLRQRFGTSDVGLAWLYFSYDEQEAQTIENLLSNLLLQLVQKRGQISDSVFSSYKMHSLNRTRPSMREYTGLLQEELRKFSKTFLIIDALDECPTQNNRRGRFISEVLSLQPAVHLLLTSRPLHDIGEMLSGASHLEIRARDEDVMLYLQNQIQQKDQLQRHIRAEPSLLEDIIKSIVQSVQGM